MNRIPILIALFAAFTLAHAQQPPPPDYSFRPDGLEAATIPGTSCTGFWKTPSFHCRPVQIPTYFARAKDGSKTAMVILTGNAGGMDSRHADYARFLAEHNITAVVIDSFAARGHSGGVAADLNAGRNRGLDALNMSIDAMTVLAVLTAQSEWQSTRVGYLGESLGGGVAITVLRPYIEGIVKEQNPTFKMRNFDSVAALYAPCFDRNTIERFKKIPFLIIQPELDDVTPVAECQKQVEWMNKRGAEAQIVVVPNEHHDMDAPWPLRSFMSMNTSKCSNLRDGERFILDSNGKEFPATPAGYNEMTSHCAYRGFKSGHRGKARVGYEIWLAHFQKTLLRAK